MEKDLKRLLAVYGLSFKKAFGQNFLSDERLLAEIVESAGVTEKDTVVEIGCGAGTLTRELAKRAGRVIGYEIDLSLKPLLCDALAEFSNVKIVYKDVMKEKIADIEKQTGGGYKIVANLPYYITTPVVMRFLENSDKLLSMSVMVQEEVARRFAATPATPDYGAITVGINLRGGAKIVQFVPREKFTPAPNVDSAVVRIDIDSAKFAGTNLAAVRDVVRAGFSSRRKTLANNLINFYKLSRAEAENALALAGIPSGARGETLSAEDFVRLSEILENAKR
ncbi:MAG: 16S rRNA (adenine(1518)-N(6)/adenine(1519)-N(6))-dimethyltransferase RsmA [Candidatus Borkfalkiaceae bacterium]|nr:16S rRNA (adenine(1518)-N(6)/adenine(1519)-N(6))-dimethyltransferase RsmA [Christensenellaceae bacterium]